MNKFRFVGLFAVMLVVLGSLSACGVKNDPDKPNKDFPRVYPTK